MEVQLISNGNLELIDKAVSKCWDKQKEQVDLKRMYRVGHKNKHESTLEHVSYTFDIDGISRACLQELARHRIASLSVKSSRYTLGELKDMQLQNGESIKDMASKFIVMTGDNEVDLASITALTNIRKALMNGKSNDVVKYALPESYKTSLVWTINMRSLRNFIELRTSKSALPEIRELAHNVYKQLPTTHKFMFVEKLDKSFRTEWDNDLVEHLKEW